MRFWASKGEEKSDRHVPYQVACLCGHLLTGSRQATFQVVRCPRCEAERFILPRSPLPAPAGMHKDAMGPAARKWPVTVWLLPGLAIVLTVSGLVVLYQFVLAPNSSPKDQRENHVKTKSPAERLELAQKHLDEGSFRLAALELAGELSSRDNLGASLRRRWRQLHREATLLADLVAEPIEDIIRHAAGVSEPEWQADFPRRYQSKAVIFDVQLQRQADGRVQAGYHLFQATDPVRLEVGDLELIRKLNLDQPQRTLFGARLAHVRLEPPGPVWVVRFQPDSGVLLTEVKAAALCCPAFGAPDAVRLLEQQAKRVADWP